MLNLTKQCALCGGQLEFQPKADRHFRNDEELEDALTYCTCENRALKGHCGECRNCKVADHGCACDGAFDAGCFNCTPAEFERPSCPAENFGKLAS